MRTALLALGWVAVRCCVADTIVVESLSYDYTLRNAILKQDGGGCKLRLWVGGDADAVIDRPWLTFVSCDHGSSFSDAGVNQHGAVKFVLVDGWLTVGEYTVTTMGEAVWLQMGVETKVEIHGSAYIIGAEYKLVSAESAQIMSTYLAPTTRDYMLKDALVVLKSNDSNQVGWASSSTVDPAHLLIIACENMQVSLHVHPEGVVYLPLSGTLCFKEGDAESCVTVGDARWNSPLLRYEESFWTSSKHSVSAHILAKRTELNCTRTPVALAVMNYDLYNPAGGPSFTDEPDPYSELLVRMTKVKSYVLVAP